MNTLAKILFPFVLLSMVSCSTMQHNIRKNNNFTDKTVSFLFHKNGNVFFIKPPYATFSIIWTYSKNKIEIFKLAKGKISERTEYSNDGIVDYQIPAFKELGLNIRECPYVLDGDILGYKIKKIEGLEEQRLPIDIECFINNKYQSEFLNKIVSDIIAYKMWDIQYQ